MNNPVSRCAIGEILTLPSINLDLQSNQRDEILQELVQQVPELSDQPAARQMLYRALQEREQLHSTGIGDGIALPHARNALVGLVERPVIVLGRHDKGVNFGAVDAVPSRLFFLLIATTVSQHLQILARISRLLRVPRLRDQLLSAPTPEKALELIQEAESQLG